jgi:hypothetical protein
VSVSPGIGWRVRRRPRFAMIENEGTRQAIRGIGRCRDDGLSQAA